MAKQRFSWISLNTLVTTRPLPTLSDVMGHSSILNCLLLFLSESNNFINGRSDFVNDASRNSMTLSLRQSAQRFKFIRKFILWKNFDKILKTVGFKKFKERVKTLHRFTIFQRIWNSWIVYLVFQDIIYETIVSYH